MNKDSYTQCKLTKRGLPDGLLTHTAWIPTSLAKIGRHLEIKQNDDSWEDGWVVAEKYSSQSFSDLDDQRKGFNCFRDKLGY